MSTTKNVLGLDLGVTSIGWALIRSDCDEKGRTLRDENGQIQGADIAATGVRIFPATTEDKTNEPKNRKNFT